MSAKKLPKPKPDDLPPALPRVHPDLPGFSVEINGLGEVTMSYTHDELNKFLNKNVKDKKLKSRKDIEGMPESFYEAPSPDEV